LRQRSELRQHEWAARGSRRDLPEKEIIQRYLTGESTPQIAKDFSVGEYTIVKVLKDHQKQSELRRSARLSGCKHIPKNNGALAAYWSQLARVLAKSPRPVKWRVSAIIGGGEEQFIQSLLGLNSTLPVVPQYAIGPYNVDIAIGHAIAWKSRAVQHPLWSERVRNVSNISSIVDGLLSISGSH